jgi:hypothetical protein
LSGTTRQGAAQGFVDRSIPDAAVAAGEKNPEPVPGFEDWFPSASPWSDVVTELLDGLVTVQGEAPIPKRDTLCIGVECQGGMRGIDAVMLIASACLVAGVTTWATWGAIRDRPWIRLALVGHFRTASDAATALRHRFAAPFKSRE